MTFEEIISGSFTPTTYAAGCPECGCTAMVLAGETPECLACFMMKEDIEVKAEQFSQAMDAIGELVRVAEGSAKAELHTLALLWQVTVARWVAATGPARG